MANLGYIRVSSVDQNTARQLDGIALDQTFIDKASGKNTDRPQLHCLLEKFLPVMLFMSIAWTDLHATYRIFFTLVETFNKRGVTVKFKKESIEFSPDKEKESYIGAAASSAGSRCAI